MERVTKNVLSQVRVADQVVVDVDLSDIDALVKLAGLTNAIVVTNEQAVYYSPTGSAVAFDSLKAALERVPEFDGIVRLAENVSFDETIQLSGRKFSVDLNGHEMANSSGTVFALYDGSEVSITNGTAKFTGEGTKFYVGYGTLSFDDVEIDIDYSENTSIWNTELVAMSHVYRESKSDEGKGIVNIGQNASIHMHGAKLGETLMTMFSMYWPLKKAGVVSNRQQYEDYIGQKNLETELNIDGRITVDESGTDEYATITTGNGSDLGRMNITVGETAVVKTDIVGLYSGNDIKITLNGGKIIAKSGIVMRSGALVVPEGAEPTVIGTGEYREYDPLHTIKTGPDHSTNLGLGHAVCLENNGVSYGGTMVSADIRSGSFVSYNNTPIGYYGIAVDAGTRTTYSEYEEPGVSETYTYEKDGQSVTKTCHFYKRSDRVGFMRYGSLNRYSSEDDDVHRYEFRTGRYPAAGIVHSGSHVNSFGNVCVEEPYCQ